MTYKSHKVDPATGRVLEVEVEYTRDYKGQKPPKGVLNWVAQPSPGQDPQLMEVCV